jgi:dihydroorotate dehydrogenase electron transfer subunit
MMTAVNPGGVLSVLGPLGVPFDLPKSGQKPILVAGGVGIAPLVFLSNACKPTEVVLFSGYSSVSQVVPEAESGLVNTSIFIATDDGTEGHHGPVTDLLENHLTGHRIHEPRVFACGPLPMLKKVATIASKLDVPCQVSLETAMACGLGACQGCAVKGSPDQEKAYFHVCCDGPVFDSRTLDWEAI